MKKELSRGKSQYIYEFPSLYSIIKQKLFSDLMQQGILIDVIYTIYEADAHIAYIAKQRHWKNIKNDKVYDIGAVLSQDSDFLIFDVPYLPLQSIRINPSSIDGSLIPSESFSSILYNIGLQELSKFINGKDIYSSLMKLCPKEQYQCILPDFATIATNDFYSSEQRESSINAYLDDLSPYTMKFFNEIQKQLDSLRGKSLKLDYRKWNIKLFYSNNNNNNSNKRRNNSQPNFIKNDFKGICAFLLACCIGKMSNTNGLNLNHSILQNILFKSVPSKSSILIHSIEAYNLARDQYYLDTPMARNEIPLRPTISGYSELYQKGNITDHMGSILGYDSGEHRIIRFDQAMYDLYNLDLILIRS